LRGIAVIAHVCSTPKSGHQTPRFCRGITRPATRKARWLYALGRIFANVAPTNLQVYEQRHATEAAIAAFRSMAPRYIGPLAAAG